MRVEWQSYSTAEREGVTRWQRGRELLDALLWLSTHSGVAPNVIVSSGVLHCFNDANDVSNNVYNDANDVSNNVYNDANDVSNIVLIMLMMLVRMF